MSNPATADSSLDSLFALQVAGLVWPPEQGARLYYRPADAAFSRDASVTGALVELGDAATLEFALPAVAVDYLRFDLPGVAGCYRFGPVVIAGHAVENMQRRMLLVHGQRLQDPDSTAEVRVAEWSGAPWFELDVRDLPGSVARTGPVKVRATVRKEHAAIEMDRRLDAAVAELSRRLQEHGQAIRSAMDEVAAANSLARLAADDRLRADMLEVHARLDQSSADTRNAQARIDRLGAETAQALAAQTESFRQELAVLRQHLEAARSQLDFLTQYELNRSLVRRALRKVKRIFRK